MAFLNSVELVQRSLEATRVTLLSARQRVEPISNSVESVISRILGKAWIHIRVFVSLTFNRGLEIRGRVAHIHVRRGITSFLC